jgi:hypothetical protein
MVFHYMVDDNGLIFMYGLSLLLSVPWGAVIGGVVW